MNALVIDASIAIKWVVEENGTSEALVLRKKAKLIAPDLLVAECANIFWKKVQRGELLKAEALFAAPPPPRKPVMRWRDLMQDLRRDREDR